MSDEFGVSLTVKTRGGDLLTVRGANSAEFQQNVAELIGGGGIAAANALFEAAQGVPAPQPHGEAAVRQVFPGAQAAGYEPPWNDSGPGPQGQLPQSMNPSCESCGTPMRYEEWVGKVGKNAGRQFKAWKCPRDKDHKPLWVN